MKINKKRLYNNLWWLFQGFAIGITPWCFWYADAVRGYDATGGEIFVPFIPLLFRLIYAEIKAGARK